MSTTVDQRVVEMRFDNKHFESNVSTSMSTLEKFKKSLDLTGAAKGLDNVNTAAKNCDLSSVGSAAEKVGLKFNAMYTIADQALRNITNSAMYYGKRIVSALTIDPIKTGFSEYETQINAVQTILANTESKGKTLDDVNGALDELNKYADKTIYNFTEMTRNIGTFTAAGVDLDTSVSAIKGIANLAAVSGSTSQQASTAMYQLSQAMASGTVKLMDWNSVVNAGMGGQVFQDALKETAKVHGVAIDDIIAKQGSFRESLSEGWLTTEILTDTLAKFTGDLSEEQLKSMGYTDQQVKEIMKLGQTANDAATKVKTFSQLFDTLKEAAQSGWTQTWEILVGDFEEAKELLTGISDAIGGIIGRSAESRNELLENWKVLGGRDDLIESFKNIFEALGSVITPIKEAFREIFPPQTAEGLAKITANLKDFTAKLKLSDKSSENLKRTFAGLFAVLDIVKEVFGAVFSAVGSLFGVFGDLGGGVLGVTANIGDFLVALRDFIKSSGIFHKVFQGIADVIKAVFKGFSSFVGLIKEKIALPGLEVLQTLFGKIRESMSGVGGAAGGMRDVVVSAFDAMGKALEQCSLFKVLQAVWNGIVKVGMAIANVLGSLIGGFFSKIGSGDFQGILDFINSLITGGIGIALINFIKGLQNPLESVGGFLEGVTGILDGVRGCFEAYQTQLKAGALMKIAGAIAILTASLVVLSMIDSDKLSTAIAAITALFAELMVSMAIFGSVAGDIKGGVFKACLSMINISLAVLLLASALKKIASLELGELAKGLLGVAGLMVLVVDAMKTLGNDEKTVIKGATQMVIIASAIKILASVCEDLAWLSWEELAKGLLGVFGLMALVVDAMKTLSSGEGTILKGTTGIVILAAAIKVLASACEDFAYMEWSEIGKGLAAIGILFAELAMFTNLTGNAEHVFSTGMAMIALAAAMKIFASAIKDIANMSWGELVKGLYGMAAALLVVAIALKLMPTNMVSTGTGLIAVSTALLILSVALDKMGGQSWESIAKGLITLGSAMFILAAGLKAMTGTLNGSASLVVAVSALAILVPVLGLLGSMKWETLAKGLIAIAGAFTIIGVAAYALTGALPAISGLAGAMALIGVGVLAAGVGLMALGAGLTTLSAGLAAVVGSLGAITVGIIEIIKAIIVGVAEGIVAFCEVIISGASTVAEAVKVLILSICEVIVECAPVIADTILEVLSSLLDSLLQYVPKIVDTLFKFIIAILEGIADNIPTLIQKVVDIFVAIFKGAVDALGSIDPESLIDGIKAIGLLTGVMVALGALASLIPQAMVGVLGLGVVIAELSIVLAALGALALIPGLKWLVESGGDFLLAVGTAIGKFIGGIAGGIAQGFTDSLPQIASDLSLFMTNLQPFIEGARLIDPSILEGVKSLVGVILAITGANVLEGIASWLTGGSSIASFAAELPLLGQGLKGFADSVAGINPESVIAAVDAAKALAEMTSIIPNEGGMISWFTGENSISKFGSELPILGQGLKGFSDSVAGINSENIIAAANAAKALADMTNIIPNEGGMLSWFSGENSISKFSEDILALGQGLKGFSDTVVGVVPENVIAAGNAAKALADMTSAIPNEGGMVSWFTGESSVSKFADQLPLLGQGLKGFSDATVGIVPENITAAANAAKALAEMSAVIPNEGGVISWFTGENSLAKFSKELVDLGKGLKGFSDATVGISPETTTAAANAAKSLAEMTTHIPNEGGIKAWFTGETSVADFASKLPVLGKGLKGFSDSTVGINPETMTSAANAAKALAEMTQHIPKEGGIKAWFTGETSIANFADKLPTLGEGLKGFSDSVAGVNAENLTAAANAAKSLAQMTETVPKDTDKIIKFGENLSKFGSKLTAYFENTKSITSESTTASSNAVNAIKDITTIDTSKLKAVSTGIDDVVKSIKNLIRVPKDSIRTFSKALAELGETSVESFLDEFDDLDDDLKKIAQKAMDAFVSGITGRTSKAKNAFKTFISSCIDAINGKVKSFETAGKNLAQGLANGISANSYLAEAKAKAMAKAAAQAAKKELDINSPSKVFRAIGYSIPEGFAAGIDKFSGIVTDSTINMADSSIEGVKHSISRLSDVVDGDIDMQPTIRPVLDLSNVKSGANSISKMFNSGPSVDVMTNIGAISSMMDQRNQNGANDDVVSAIEQLAKELSGSRGDTYNFGNISYDDDSSIAAAVRDLVRAARVERRV